MMLSNYVKSFVLEFLLHEDLCRKIFKFMLTWSIMI